MSELLSKVWSIIESGSTFLGFVAGIAWLAGIYAASKKNIFVRFPYLKTPAVVATGFVAGLIACALLPSSAPRTEIKAKTRIVLLLPTGQVVRSTYKDGQRQLYGFAQYLDETDSQKTEDFEFVPINSAMEPSVARRFLISELEKGTNYFISTMSSVSEPLSAEFESLAAKYVQGGRRPILLCTVASSPLVKVRANSVYRLFPRAQEEATVLAGRALSDGVKSVGFVAVNDAYGRSMVDEFLVHWRGHTTDETVLVDIAADDVDIEFALRQSFLKPGKVQPDALLVAHYGHGLSSVLRVMDKLKIRSRLLLTIPMSIRDWQEAAIEPLSRMRWVVSVPDYSPIDASKDDVIRDFTTYTIRKVVQAVTFMNEDSSLTFDESWRKSEVSIGLKITWEASGDSVVPLIAVGPSHFKLFGKK